MTLQKMEIENAMDDFAANTHAHKQPIVRYPQHTRRILGRTWPGDAERTLRKMLHRKESRKQAAMLCQFIIFKKGKFMPSKMI